MAQDLQDCDASSSAISQVRTRGASRTDGANFGRICAKTEVVQNKYKKMQGKKTKTAIFTCV